MTRCIQRTNSPFQGLKRRAFLWNGWMLTFFIAVGLCFFAKAASCNILLSSNLETCTKDDELVFSIGYDGSYPMGVDVYVAISIPNDPNFYFWPDFGTTPKPCAVGWIPEAFPLTPFFSYRFVGPEPQGSYRVYAALFKTGTFDASTLVGGIPFTSVTYTGAGGSSPVISVEPADGSVVGTQPTFRISFIGPIDLESVIDHSEFQIKSVSSGRRVRVYTDDSNVHWVEVYVPPPDEMSIQFSSEADLPFMPVSVDNGQTIEISLGPVTIEGQTFSLHSGGTYRFQIKFFAGAQLQDGTSLRGITVGPITFHVK